MVKLSAEVADLSPDMSRIPEQSVQAIVEQLAKTLREGLVDGQPGHMNTRKSLQGLFCQLWPGASLVAGLSRNNVALTSALRVTKALISAV